MSDVRFRTAGPRAALIGIALTAVFAQGACEGNPVSPTARGSLLVLLTDAPIGDVERVEIFFTSLKVKPAGGPPFDLDLVLADNPIDLLTLSDRVTALATGSVAAGDYEFIQVNIDPARSRLVESGAARSLKAPSTEVKILGGFTVEADQQTTITLDFDATRSLVSLGNGDWLLKPLIVRK